MTVATPAFANDLYFPPFNSDWETVAPEDAGLDPEGLAAAAAHAESEHSSALLMLHNGRIVLERHWRIDANSNHSSARYQRMLKGYTEDGHAIEDVASVQKSVVSFLAGVAVTQGNLSLDEPAKAYLNTGWSRAKPDQEKDVTVRHLMSMTSGLTDGLEFREPPGTVWRYNTGAYSQMGGVLEAVFDKDINALTSEWLTNRIGMTKSKWMPRPWAVRTDAANKIGFATTARDLARFGVLILANGEWEGESLGVSRSYLNEMLSPSQELNPSYGLLWWLNGQSHSIAANRAARRRGPLLRTGPDDLVAARGALGRSLYVSPSLELVVVRFGNQPGLRFDIELWRLIMKAKIEE